MPRGYDRPVYILPFEHRNSFQNKVFGWDPPLSDAKTAEIADQFVDLFERKHRSLSSVASSSVRPEYCSSMEG